MLTRIKKLFTREVVYFSRIEIDLKVPQFDKQYMFWDKDQAKQFYLFMCANYIKSLKNGNIELSKHIGSMIQDFVILGEWIEFYGLTKEYSIK